MGLKHIQTALLLTAFLIANTLYSQTIKGTVTTSSNAPISGVSVHVKGTTKYATTNRKGQYSIIINDRHTILVFSYFEFKTKEINAKNKITVNVVLEKKSKTLIEVEEIEDEKEVIEYDMMVSAPFTKHKQFANKSHIPIHIKRSNYNTEDYTAIEENDFKDVLKNPLSTFSVDVDAASYSNIRRFINNGSLPPIDAVRIEEMINYFNYDYEAPKNNLPFSINTELSTCPWNEDNLLLHIGLQGKKVEMDKLPPSNIVFLLDVSGSMSDRNKLPLLKSSLKLLLESLRPQDRVAIVVYAGSSGLVLPSTSCNEKKTILNALERLSAGGATAGGEGLKLAYKVANENFIKHGNNRIILATDGDFNVGQSSNAEMQRLIEKERDNGIAMSVLGFGMGNYKDNKMEIIADKGNGNYAYIDNLLEARKVLVSEFGGTLYTIAKDVKFQLEFNPSQVSEYRLIGYENRLLNEEDFDNDKKDAGEIGSGHTVTALYEIVTTKNNKYPKNNLKYQFPKLTKNALTSNDLITLKLRYKHPKENRSKLITQSVKNNPIDLVQTSNNFRFSAAVTQFGMLLRNSSYLCTTTWDSTYNLAKNAKGNDDKGYRGELIRLIESAKLLR